MVLQKEVVVDGRGHLLGRLAATVAKQLLQGQRVAIVRCEDIVMSGSLYRNKINFSSFMKKRMATNPTRGPFHERSPSAIVRRTIRGMVPHLTKRGSSALARLTVVEGVPAPYDKVKRVVVPEAYKLLRVKPGRNTARLGDLSNLFGWKYDSLIGRLEDKRKVRARTRYLKKKEQTKLQNKAAAQVTGDFTAVLSKFGY